MPLNLYFLKSFDRSRQNFPQLRQEKIQDTVRQIIQLVHRNIQTPHGLRVKKISSTVFEARVDIHLRLLLEIKEGSLIFILVGTHGEVRRYLKNV